MMLNILSLGAGVQSSTLALMAAHGEITPMPDAAIFADTGAEPQPVMKWLDWLEARLPFPVYRVMHKDGLKASVIDSAKGRFASPPFYTDSVNGGGIMKRQCTYDYKIAPITKKIRNLIGLEHGERAKQGVQVTQWIGISADEIQRMKESHHHYIQHRWPLLEKRMTRGHCLEWMKEHGYPEPPRSACTFCPYHSNHEWRRMKSDDPESWNDAVMIDGLIRNSVRGTKEKLYLHRDRVPLAEADLTDPHEHQRVLNFMDECEGMCGV